MAAKVAAKPMSETYYQLVRRFPLTRIRTDDQLDEAQEMIDQLLTEDLDSGGREYLDVLTDLVEAYEAEHVIIPDAAEADVLRELIRSSGLSQHALAERVGISQSTISDVVRGARSPTRDQVVVLARFFHVSPAAFLPG